MTVCLLSTVVVDLASNFKAALVDIIEVCESESENENENEKLVIITGVFCDLLFCAIQMQAACLHLKNRCPAFATRVQPSS